MASESPRGKSCFQTAVHPILFLSMGPINVIRRNQRGSIVIAMLVAIAMSIIGLVAALMQRSSQQSKLDRQLLVSIGVRGYVYSVRSLLLSQASFVKSARSPLNPSFWSCLNDPEFDCAPVAGPQNFFMLADDGSTFLDLSPGRGLDRAMNPCTGHPSVSCPFRFELKWERTCGTPTDCRSPSIMISGDLLIADSEEAIAVNPELYRVRLVIR